MAFDYTAILARYDDFPSMRMYYRFPHESGWASQLDETHAMLDNVPATGGLMARDIVMFTRHDGDLPRVAHVLQRYYRWQWSVAYLEPDDATDKVVTLATYTRVRLACEAVGCACEGAYAGLAIVNAPEDVDLRTVLEPLGLTGAALVLYQPSQ